MGPGGQINYLNAIEVAALVAISMRNREAAGPACLPAPTFTVSNRSLSAARPLYVGGIVAHEPLCAVLEQPPGSVRPGAQDLWHRMERVRHGQGDLCLSALSFVETFPCCLSDPPKRHARVLRMKVVLRSTDGGNVHTRQV